MQKRFRSLPRAAPPRPKSSTSDSSKAKAPKEDVPKAEEKPKEKPTTAAAAEEEAQAGAEKTEEAPKPAGGKVGKLMREYGVPFVIWYLIVEEGSWAGLTALLHYHMLGEIDAQYLIEKSGLNINLNKNSFWLFGYEISARLMGNIAAAGGVITIASPWIIGFCIATLPGFKMVARPLIRRWDKPVAAAGAAAGAGGAAAS